MKKNIFILIGVAIIIIIIGGWFVINNATTQQNSQGETEVTPTENVAQNVVLVIDNGQEPAETFQIKFEEGMTAFDLLRNKSEELGFNLKTKTYDIGIMVECIGEKDGGEDGKYWMYYVNGEMPMISADKMILKPGDKVEFKFEKSTF